MSSFRELFKSLYILALSNFKFVLGGNMININSLSKSFNNGIQKTTVLHNVTFTISKGIWLSIMGPSGSGKTTLLNCISGLSTPDVGSVIIGNKDLSELKGKEISNFRRKNIGFVFQDFKLLPHYSVIDNVILPLTYDESRRTLETRAKKLLNEVGIDESLFNRLPNGLSGGEKQRVAIARALIADPDLLLCDEPTGNLDKDNRDQIVELLFTLKKKGKTIIVVTHDEEVAEKGDLIYQLKDGNLVDRGLMI